MVVPLIMPIFADICRALPTHYADFLPTIS
jgi:hypothetical protein